VTAITGAGDWGASASEPPRLGIDPRVLDYPGFSGFPGLEPEHGLPDAIMSHDRDSEAAAIGLRSNRVCCHAIYMVTLCPTVQRLSAESVNMEHSQN
jgi:hypothetical protein